MSQTSIVHLATDEVTIKPVKLPNVDESIGQGVNLLDGNFSLVQGVKVKLEVVVGQTEITVGELFGLKNNAVVKLEQETAAPVEVRLDNKTIARGHLMVVGNNLGVRIDEIVSENA